MSSISWFLLACVWFSAAFMWRRANEEERQRHVDEENARKKQKYFDDKYSLNTFIKRD